MLTIQRFSANLQALRKSIFVKYCAFKARSSATAKSVCWTRSFCSVVKTVRDPSRDAGGCLTRQMYESGAGEEKYLCARAGRTACTLQRSGLSAPVEINSLQCEAHGPVAWSRFSNNKPCAGWLPCSPVLVMSFLYMMKTPEVGRCLIKKKWPEVLINKTHWV